MDMFEEAVMWYVCAGNQRYVCPQYWVRKDEKDWSCPDFVAIDPDPKSPSVYIIEVTTASNIGDLAARINKRDEQWINPIKEQLPIPFKNWEIYIVAFVRSDDLVDILNNKVVNKNRYRAFSLEKIIQTWKWDWDKSKNIPVNPLK
jgi:hypothetical protein